MIYTGNHVKNILAKFEENQIDIKNIKKDLNTTKRLIKLEKDVEWLKMKNAKTDFIEILKIITIIVAGYIIITALMSALG